MKYTKYIAAVVLSVLFLFPSTAQARKYAVLISAGASTADDAVIDSEYWYDLFLQYKTLLAEGYEHDDIYVLYGYGSPFNSSKQRYRSSFPFNIVDYPVTKANIRDLFIDLGDVVTEDDSVYIWWLGHGTYYFGHYWMAISTTYEEVQDDEFESWVGEIDNFRFRSFSIMTCQSGYIVDDLENDKSVVTVSCLPEEYSASDWLCDTYHTEMHYYERAAFEWDTPGSQCGSIDADDDDNGLVTFAEAFADCEDGMIYTEPQYSDIGGWGDTEGIAYPSIVGDVDLDGDVDISDLAALLAAYGSCPGDADYIAAADFMTDNLCITLGDLSALLGNYGY